MKRTYLFPDGLSGRQLGLHSDEEGDKRSLALGPQRVVTGAGAVAALLTVAQQHGRRVHLERSIDLARRS